MCAVDTDISICHAGEDKASVARPLGDALLRRGWTVWLDEVSLALGDSLSRNIDVALTRCRYGVVVLSRSFFAKEWPQRELAGLVTKEIDTRRKVILPVWHGIDHSYIAKRSPTLADRVGASTARGIDDVANKISLAVGAGMSAPSAASGEAADAAWRGILGGAGPTFVGAHTIESTTGRHGQVVYALGSNAAVVRFDDGMVARVKPR